MTDNYLNISIDGFGISKVISSLEEVKVFALDMLNQSCLLLEMHQDSAWKFMIYLSHRGQALYLCRFLGVEHEEIKSIEEKYHTEEVLKKRNEMVDKFEKEYEF